MQEHLPDELLARTHRSLLNQKRIQQLHFSYKIKDDTIKELVEQEGFVFIGTKRFLTQAVVFFSVPDGDVRAKALDFAYKLKKKYGDITVKHKFGDATDADIEAEIASVLSEAIGLAEGESAEVSD